MRSGSSSFKLPGYLGLIADDGAPGQKASSGADAPEQVQQDTPSFSRAPVSNNGGNVAKFCDDSDGDIYDYNNILFLIQERVRCWRGNF
jgi:hypothetical protein